MNSSLAGRRIVNTRAVHQAAALDALLRERGAMPLAYPCIAIAPPEDTSALDAALHDLAAGRYDWLLLTSANTVFALAQRLPALKLSLPPIAAAAVGTATAAAAQEKLGLTVDVIPEKFVAKALAQKLLHAAGTHALLPESAIAPPTLANALTQAGVTACVVPAYTTVQGSGGVDLPRLLARREVDAVAFTSGSTVDHFLRRLESEGGTHAQLEGVCVACIGPQTADAARTHGLRVDVTAQTHTLPGLVEALAAFFDR